MEFSSFWTGLVGGHCIGVDPYYLTFKAEALGYDTKIITAGRKLNDSMSIVVADKLVRSMVSNNIEIAGSKVVMG